MLSHINSTQSFEMNQAVKNVIDLLETCRLDYENKHEATHRSYGEVLQGNFKLDKLKRKEFLTLYYKALDLGFDNFSIIEIQKEYSCILIDIDLIQSSDKVKDDQRLYNKKMIRNIIKKYIKAINHYLNVDNNKLESSVFEKNKPTKKETEIKDGFHIMFRNIITNSDIRHKIREYVVKSCEEDGLFDEFINKTDNIIDKAVVSSNGWLLYGSRKPGCEPYILSKIYNSELEKVNLTNYFNDDITYEKLVKYYTISSTHNEKLSSPIKQQYIKPNNETKEEIKDEKEEEPSEELMDKLDFALNNVEESRSENYDTWLLCSFILKNLGEDYKPLFINFSRRSNKHKKVSLNELTKHWNNIKDKSSGKKATTSTIYYWLKEDNFEAFEEMNKKYKLIKELTPLEKWYKEQKEKFEEDHFIEQSNAQIYTEPDEIMTDYKAQPIAEYKNLKLNVNFKQIEHIGKQQKEKTYYFFPMWLEDKNRREYKKLIFRPDLPSIIEVKDYKYLNRFNGFNYDSDIKETKLNEIVDKVFNHIFNNDTDYIYSWISWIINNPSQKTDHGIVLYSELHGVGKNSIVELLIKLFDRYYGRMATIDDVSRNFNTHLCNKLLIYGDEIKPSKKDLADELKNIISTTKTNEERKGVDVEVINDYANYIFTTNNELSFNVQPGDRRYYLVECPNFKLDKSIINEYYNILKNDNELTKIFSFFKHYKSEIYKDIKNNDPPMTDYKSRVIAQKLPGYIHFWYTQAYCPNGCKISSTKLYNIIREYSQSKRITSAFTPCLFGLEMKKLGFETVKNSSIYYKIPKLEERKKLLKQAYPKYYIDLDTENLSDHIEYDDNDNDNEQINDLDK